jgi:RNA polymerase sigma-70 factor (ECF subfamily)
MTEGVISGLVGQSPFDTTTDTADITRTLSAGAGHGAVSDLNRLADTAAEGDHPSTEMLLRLVQPLVVRYCRTQLGREEDSFASADDVAQDVCLAVFTTLHLYRNQDLPFLAFVYAIAVYKVTAARRAAARDRTGPAATLPDEPDSQLDPEHQGVMRDVLATWVALMRRMLTAKQWEILMLRLVVRLSVEETADAIGSSPRAVQVTLHKALATIRQAAFRRDRR